MAEPQREAAIALRPSTFWAEMAAARLGDSQGLADVRAAVTPLRVVGRPDHMTDAILRLISDDSARATGAEPTADGRRGAD